MMATSLTPPSAIRIIGLLLFLSLLITKCLAHNEPVSADDLPKPCRDYCVQTLQTVQIKYCYPGDSPCQTLCTACSHLCKLHKETGYYYLDCRNVQFSSSTTTTPSPPPPQPAVTHLVHTNVQQLQETTPALTNPQRPTWKPAGSGKNNYINQLQRPNKPPPTTTTTGQPASTTPYPLQNPFPLPPQSGPKSQVKVGGESVNLYDKSQIRPIPTSTLDPLDEDAGGGDGMSGGMMLTLGLLMLLNVAAIVVCCAVCYRYFAGIGKKVDEDAALTRPPPVTRPQPAPITSSAPATYTQAPPQPTSYNYNYYYPQQQQQQQQVPQVPPYSTAYTPWLGPVGYAAPPPPQQQQYQAPPPYYGGVPPPPPPPHKHLHKQPKAKRDSTGKQELAKHVESKTDLTDAESAAYSLYG